jgi:uncharacterized protein YqgC (DUF456 family)
MKSIVTAGVAGWLALCAVPQSLAGPGGATGPVWCLSSAMTIMFSHQGSSSLCKRPSGWRQGPLFVMSDPIDSSPDSVESSNEKKDSWLRRGGRIAGSIFARVALYLALLVGLVMIPLGLGGTFVMVGAAALFGALTGFEQIGLKLLGLLLGLALLGEGIESVLGVAMARKYGASKWGMWGAFLGGILGAIVGTPVPVVGNLVGALVGVFAGAFLLEWLGRGLADKSLKAGWGALLGRAAASAIKLGLGMIILVLVVARTLS